MTLFCIGLACFFLCFGFLGLFNAFTSAVEPGDDTFVIWLFALAALFLIAAGVWR